MKLVNVYEKTLGPGILYEILAARLKEPGTNISHNQLPTFDQHCEFMASLPYKGWYFIESQSGTLAGVCYITHQNELGIYILRNHRGKGVAGMALRLLMETHPADRYLANINPDNEASIALFKSLGFNILQHTYQRRGT